MTLDLGISDKQALVMRGARVNDLLMVLCHSWAMLQDRQFDKTQLDRQHVLRSLQRRRTFAIIDWLVVPWLIAGAIIFAAVRLL